MNFLMDDFKQCSKCKILKLKIDFRKQKSTKDGLKCECKFCNSLYDRRYRERPIVREKQQKYQSRPEVKNKKNKYRRRPEVRARQRIKDREYKQNLEVRGKLKIYRKRYYSKPGVKEKAIKRVKINHVIPLSDCYLRALLRGSGFDNKDITYELINTKREQLFLHRELIKTKRRLRDGVT